MSSNAKFLRLEAPGYWRQNVDKPGRHVVVHLGDTSITLISKSNVALGHWSLHGVRRIDSGAIPAIYAVDAGETEVVEISDETMIDAIEQWQRDEAVVPPQFKLPIRGIVAALLVLTAVAAVAYFAPREGPRLAASFVTPSNRAEIGEQLFETLKPEFAQHCESQEGAAALNKLAAKLHPGERGEIRIVDGLEAASMHLPGGIVIIDKGLLMRHDGPEAVAGHVLLERLLMAENDPIARLIDNAGLTAVPGIVLEGSVDDELLLGFFRSIQAEPRPPVAQEDILERFRTAGFSSTPFGLTFDGNQEVADAAVENDPFKGATYRPLLSDGDWIRLQGICDV